jgi:uncharacterized protein YdeI (YjbR/CyaY-like superfamily)
LSFFKGVLLKDQHNLLIQRGENSQSVKLFQFTSVKQIVELEKIIKEYVFEAIEIEKAGLKIELKKSKDLVFPEEIESFFKENEKFKAAFKALTPGKQRGYHIFYTGAKQSATRTSRIESSIPRVLQGKAYTIAFVECLKECLGVMVRTRIYDFTGGYFLKGPPKQKTFTSPSLSA